MSVAGDADATDAPRRVGERSATLYGAVGLGAPGYRREDVARLAGIDHARSVRWWRAMGFAEVPEDAAAFAELDIEILKRLAALTGAGLVDDEAPPALPDIHCGIAYGPTVAVGGDVFGPTANLAARLTTIARRGTIVIPRTAASQLAGRGDIEIVRMRRTFDLKGIGDTHVVAVRRSRDAAYAALGGPEVDAALADARGSHRPRWKCAPVESL